MRFSISFAALAMAAALSSQALAQDDLPEGPGKVAIQEDCAQCHDLGTAIGQKRSPDEWVEVVDRMTGFGLTLTDARRTEILQYLNANRSTAPAVAAPPATGGAHASKTP
ncbi:MAG: hypothetical protein CFE28_04140 [Alphaproteobacteria bacterium PA2]|nr:MAG: hypothetical protein CFE28_04140 [Alphaproteobacteria bacterium PA2]